jgi:hypothetical protein
MEGSAPVQLITDPDFADPKLYGSYGSGSGALVTMEISVSAINSDSGTSLIKMMVSRESKKECATFYAF